MAPMTALKSESSSIIFSLLQRLILILKDPQRSSCSTLSFQGVGSLLTHLQKSNPFSSFFLKTSLILHGRMHFFRLQVLLQISTTVPTSWAVHFQMISCFYSKLKYVNCNCYWVFALSCVLHIPMEYECETKQSCFYKNWAEYFG